jgi:hypothetical protein
VDDEPDAARVVLVMGRVKALRGELSLVAHSML